jgi:hypothetical protein
MSRDGAASIQEHGGRHRCRSERRIPRGGRAPTPSSSGDMRNTVHGRGAHPPLQRASLLDGDADDAGRAPPASTARPLRVHLLPPPPLPTRFSGEGELSPASLAAGGSGTLAGGSSSCRRSRSSLCIFPSSSSLPCSTSRSAVVTCPSSLWQRRPSAGRWTSPLLRLAPRRHHSFSPAARGANCRDEMHEGMHNLAGAAPLLQHRCLLSRVCIPALCICRSAELLESVLSNKYDSPNTST